MGGILSFLSSKQPIVLSAKEPLTLGDVRPVELDQRGFVLSEIRKGNGKSYPRKGDEVSFAFYCWLIDGTLVSSSMLVMSKVGVGRLIRGLDRGLMRMCVGQKCKLLCSPNHGYGLFSIPGTAISSGDILIFEVEVISIKRKEEQTSQEEALPAFGRDRNSFSKEKSSVRDRGSVAEVSVRDPRHSFSSFEVFKSPVQGQPEPAVAAEPMQRSRERTRKSAVSFKMFADSIGDESDDNTKSKAVPSLRSSLKTVVRSSITSDDHMSSRSNSSDVPPRSSPPVVDDGRIFTPTSPILSLTDLPSPFPPPTTEGMPNIDMSVVNVMQLEAQVIPPPDDD